MCAARVLFPWFEMYEASHVSDTARTSTATFERLRHVCFGRRVIERDFIASANRSSRVKRITFDARDWIARVIEKSPRVSRAHLGVRQLTVGFDVTTSIDLNRVTRGVTLHASADGEDALTAREIARGVQRSAMRCVMDENRER
jgi:hypothetical protein